jgi:2'-5' RNA ligase
MITSRSSYFIAFQGPNEALTENLGSLDLAKSINLVHTDDLHITVAYLGEVTEDVALDAWMSLRALPQSAISCQRSEWKLMGSMEKPTAIAITLNSINDELKNVIQTWRSDIKKAGVEVRSQHDILPHITIFRIRSEFSVEPSQACSFFLLISQLPLAESFFNIDQIVLYRSGEHGPSRSYTIVARRRLDERL